jgi:hypothetical protein
MDFRPAQWRDVNGDGMHKTIEQDAKFRAEKKALGFNLSKLQAAGCLAVSALASIGLIYFGATALI